MRNHKLLQKMSKQEHATPTHKHYTTVSLEYCEYTTLIDPGTLPVFRD